MTSKGGRGDRGQVFLSCSLSASWLWLIPAGGRGGLSLGFRNTVFSPCPLRTRASCCCSSRTPQHLLWVLPGSHFWEKPLRSSLELTELGSLAC